MESKAEVLEKVGFFDVSIGPSLGSESLVPGSDKLHLYPSLEFKRLIRLLESYRIDVYALSEEMLDLEIRRSIKKENFFTLEELAMMLRFIKSQWLVNDGLKALFNENRDILLFVEAFGKEIITVKMSWVLRSITLSFVAFRVLEGSRLTWPKDSYVLTIGSDT